MSSKLHVSDEQLFTIHLFSAFVNNNYIKTDRNERQQLWKEGIKEVEALGLHSSLMSPIIIMAINHGLETDYSNWFIKNYNKMINSEQQVVKIINWNWEISVIRPILNFLNSFNNLKINLSNVRIKIKEFFNNNKLNEEEKKNFNKFIIIKELEDTIIILLYNEILKNEEMIKFFIENFITITIFSKTKKFIIYFMEKNRIKLFRYYFLKIFYSKKKYEYEEIIYEILTKNFDIFKVEGLMNNYNYIKGFMIDLNKFSIKKNIGLNFILKIWNEMNDDDDKIKMSSKL
jgi:hypothetical protein